MKKTKTLYDLLLDAEEKEKEATAARVELENEIFHYLKSEKLLTKTEGAETVEELGFSITCNQPYTYKIDEEKYRALPGVLQTIHSIKINLDKKKYNSFLETASKSDIKQISDVVTVSPGKVSIKVKKS